MRTLGRWIETALEWMAEGWEETGHAVGPFGEVLFLEGWERRLMEPADAEGQRC